MVIRISAPDLVRELVKRKRESDEEVFIEVFFKTRNTVGQEFSRIFVLIWLPRFRTYIARPVMPNNSGSYQFMPLYFPDAWLRYAKFKLKHEYSISHIFDYPDNERRIYERLCMTHLLEPSNRSRGNRSP